MTFSAIPDGALKHETRTSDADIARLARAFVAAAAEAELRRQALTRAQTDGTLHEQARLSVASNIAKTAESEAALALVMACGGGRK